MSVIDTSMYPSYPATARIPLRSGFVDLTQTEVFVPVNVEGYRQAYQVSQLGTIRRTKRGEGTRVGKILKPRADRGGYLYVNLWNNCQQKTIKVHRLVALTFLGEPPTENHEVAHWDGDKKNNVIWNLRWAVHKDNMRDGLRHGTVIIKFTEDHIRRVFKLRAQGLVQIEIGERMGISKAQVCRILNSKSQTDLVTRVLGEIHADSQFRWN